MMLATPINYVFTQNGAERIDKDRMEMFKKSKATQKLSNLTSILKIIGTLFNSLTRFVIGW